MLLVEAITVAAQLLGWCGAFAAEPVEGRTLAFILLGILTAGVWEMLTSGLLATRIRRESNDDWWGVDARVRRLATPLALGGCLALVVWATVRAEVGAKLGGAGSLLVLLVVSATGAKLVAETYLYAQIGEEESQRQASAKRLIGPLSRWAKWRYVLGVFGGVILPLGAQLLAGGAKNIPAVVDAGPPAVLATLALLCLLPAEMIERWLFWRDVRDAGSGQ